MPIEIKELHIRINVNDSSRLTNGQSGGTTESKPKEMVDVCVENVMKILADKKER